MRFRSKNDQRGTGRSGERMGGWGQPGVQEAIPRQGPGFLALLPGAFENVVPELAQLDAQGVAAMDQGTSQPVPPLLEHPAELLETDFAPMLSPADRARVRVPPEDEDGGEQARPDFTLHAAWVGTFGDIQAQDPFALAEDEFNLPAEAVEVTEHGAGQFSGGGACGPKEASRPTPRRRLWGCVPVCAGIRADRPAAGRHSPGSSERPPLAPAQSGARLGRSRAGPIGLALGSWPPAPGPDPGAGASPSVLTATS